LITSVRLSSALLAFRSIDHMTTMTILFEKRVYCKDNHKNPQAYRKEHLSVLLTKKTFLLSEDMSSNFTDDERFDGLYLNVANTTRGIEPLLDTVFSFCK
jgi:hypothetical protein